MSTPPTSADNLTAGGPAPGLPVPLGEVARVFLAIGLTAFGGPAAHVAMMEAELVRRRGWLDRERFLDLVGATNLIPGPNSTELAIHIGQDVAGWRGLVVAGACFILPAALIVGAIAAAYVAWGALPQLAGLLAGVQPVIVAVLLQALWGLGRTALRTRALAALGLAAAAANLAGLHELAVLGAAGAGAAGLQWLRAARGRPGGPPLAAIAGWPLLALGPAAVPEPVAPVGLAAIFGFFLKTGSVLFGSGYVLLAFLRADLVTRWGWISEAQLLDAVAVGQVTPGPVFTTATFVGYVLAGPAGAAVATAGIFLPAFAFVALSRPLIPAMRRSPVAGALLDGVNVASLALMAVVAGQLAAGAIAGPWSAAIALVAAIALLRLQVNAAWLVGGGAIAGLAGAAVGWR